jgi:electron transfer flavoprotein alpha subunit
MGGVLVIAEARRGELREVSLELITAARAVKDAAGGRLAVALIDADASAHATVLAADGVDEVLTVSSPSPNFEAHVAARALAALIEAEQPVLVLLGHTIDAMGFGPAVAARGRLGFASDVIWLGWDGGPLARRGAYADKLLDELEFPGKDCTLLMIRPGTFSPAAPGDGAGAPSGAQAPARAFEVADLLDAARSEHVAFREVPAGDVDITKADFLLSIGRGVADRDNIPRFEELAERLGATLSVSRPIVDAGWMPSARQVGQSGKTVKPRLYLAFGISGAVQHLAGMRTAETIIAVNTDPEAPIFGVAHYGAVADMFELADALEAQFA